MESELFGLESSVHQAPNNISDAVNRHQGTLFTDNYEMDINLQSNSCAFTGTHHPHRRKKKIEIDTRVVSATNREPLRAIDDGFLREIYFTGSMSFRLFASCGTD